MTENTEDIDDRPPSKSQRKRDMHALQDLGEVLIKLNKKQLSTIPLPDNLLIAINEIHDMPMREARRRHLQLIGKLMRYVDGEAVREALNKLLNTKNLHVQQQHHIEHWRDKLLSGEKNALKQFIDDYTHVDIQYLRQLIREAQKEQSHNKPPAYSRKLFKYIRETMNA